MKLTGSSILYLLDGQHSAVRNWWLHPEVVQMCNTQCVCVCVEEDFVLARNWKPHTTEKGWSPWTSRPSQKFSSCSVHVCGDHCITATDISASVKMIYSPLWCSFSGSKHCFGTKCSRPWLTLWPALYVSRSFSAFTNQTRMFLLKEPWISLLSTLVALRVSLKRDRISRGFLRTSLIVTKYFITLVP